MPRPLLARKLSEAIHKRRKPLYSTDNIRKKTYRGMDGLIMIQTGNAEFARFGDFVSSKRHERKITSLQMAETLGLSPGYYCDIEKNRSNPPDKTILVKDDEMRVPCHRPYIGKHARAIRRWIRPECARRRTQPLSARRAKEEAERRAEAIPGFVS
jgi:transcriptional regulator with XRE-family HTH domain